jgi:DNA-directed RNA polymerase specialized sigma subunit
VKPAGIITKENFSNEPSQALEQLMESYGPIVMRTAGRSISVEDVVFARLKKSEVLQHLLRLPLPYQEALYLYYYLDFSTREIAEATSAPEGTVRTRLHQAHEAMAREMDKEE